MKHYKYRKFVTIMLITKTLLFFTQILSLKLVVGQTMGEQSCHYTETVPTVGLE